MEGSADVFSKKKEAARILGPRPASFALQIASARSGKCCYGSPLLPSARICSREALRRGGEEDEGTFDSEKERARLLDGRRSRRKKRGRKKGAEPCSSFSRSLPSCRFRSGALPFHEDEARRDWESPLPPSERSPSLRLGWQLPRSILSVGRKKGRRRVGKIPRALNRLVLFLFFFLLLSSPFRSRNLSTGRASCGRAFSKTKEEERGNKKEQGA